MRHTGVRERLGKVYGGSKGEGKEVGMLGLEYSSEDMGKLLMVMLELFIGIRLRLHCYLLVFVL